MVRGILKAIFCQDEQDGQDKRRSESRMKRMKGEESGAKESLTESAEFS
jgi:hypothetical protein